MSYATRHTPHATRPMPPGLVIFSRHTSQKALPSSPPSADICLYPGATVPDPGTSDDYHPTNARSVAPHAYGDWSHPIRRRHHHRQHAILINTQANGHTSIGPPSILPRPPEIFCHRLHPHQEPESTPTNAAELHCNRMSAPISNLASKYPSGGRVFITHIGILGMIPQYRVRSLSTCMKCDISSNNLQPLSYRRTTRRLSPRPTPRAAA